MASTIFHKPMLRWSVPAIVAISVGTAAVMVPMVAGADAELPDRSAQELLVDLAEIESVPFSGTLVQSADLGLPEIPGLSTGTAGSPGAALLSLLTGSTTARLWYSGDDQFRVALQDELAESDLIRNDDGLWYWNSEHNTVTRVLSDDYPSANAAPPSESSGADPMRAMTEVLETLGASTRAEVDGTATVAGRAAYELVLTPLDEESSIGSIRLAIDGDHSVPLRIQVHDRDGGDPALEIGFTSISFDDPDPSVFEFTPPPGAEVTELDATELDATELDATAMEQQRFEPGSSAGWDVVGEGWSSVFVARDVSLDDLGAGLSGDHPEMSDLIDTVLDGMTEVSGAYGQGVALTSGLLSALVLDDGRLLVGAVPVDVLEEAAALDPAAAP